MTLLRLAFALVFTALSARAVDNWFYGYSWPPHKISRSTDGVKWELVPNEKEWQAKSFAHGPLSGGEPPKLPPGPKPKTAEAK